MAHGYTLEAANYFWLYASNGANLRPMYRCVFGNSHHFLTTDANCEGIGTSEAIMGYGPSSQQAGTVPLYRLYDAGTGDHFYTIDASERQSAINAGFASEGITIYVRAVQ
jgi:hypothetical protein